MVGGGPSWVFSINQNACKNKTCANKSRTPDTVVIVIFVVAVVAVAVVVAVVFC